MTDTKELYYDSDDFEDDFKACDITDLKNGNTVWMYLSREFKNVAIPLTIEYVKKETFKIKFKEKEEENQGSYDVDGTITIWVLPVKELRAYSNANCIKIYVRKPTGGKNKKRRTIKKTRRNYRRSRQKKVLRI
jgi:hypothetical protein